MKSVKRSFLLIITIILAILLVRNWNHLNRQDDWQTVARNREFDRRTSTLQYTKHALCRMDCRYITKSDVEEIMLTGEINYAKSDMNDQPCPTYALQGYTTDHQLLRVIFAQCETTTKVVTCYDLEKDFECFCPGDEKKNKNK